MLLLDYGARTDIRNERHELAADCTIDPELAKALTDGSTEARRVAQDLDFFASPAGQRSNPPTTPFKAVKSGNLEQLQECLNSPDHRCDLDTPDKKTGKTLLHISSEMGMLRITEELVRAGADPQVPSPASHKIPLHLACKGDHLEVSRFLCSAEDDDGITYRIVNSQDRLGNSPLHYAVANGSLEMAAMLLGKGSRLDLTNVLGKRPVDIAVDQSREALVKLLSSSDKKVTPQRFP